MATTTTTTTTPTTTTTTTTTPTTTTTTTTAAPKPWEVLTFDGEFGFTRYEMDSSARRNVNITPSDTVRLPFVGRALYVGGTGNIVVTSESGETAIYYNVPAGSFIAVIPIMVWATDTTATNIVLMG